MRRRCSRRSCLKELPETWRAWLLVTAANPGAQQLYQQAGFEEAGRYLYRQQRPRRALTGC
jgi:predicted GNAT family acetyltransferase